MNIKEAEKLAAKLEPQTRRAFLNAINGIVDAASIAEIEAAIEKGLPNEVIAALGLASTAPMVELQEELRRVYVTTANETLRTINKPPGGRIDVFFNIQKPEPINYLSELSSKNIVQITEEQRDAVRQALSAGQQQGRNPRSVALDIVGRVENGRRQGGVVGLHSQYSQAVSNARAELSSGNAAEMRNYFSRVRRDRRFDSIVQKAIDSGKPVSQADINRITTRYSDRLLQLRGELIARTETLQAMSIAQEHAIKQLAEDQGLPANAIKKKWRTSSDSRVRDSHSAINGEVITQGQRYSNGLRYPRDQRGSLSEVWGCRCWEEPQIDYISNS